MEDEVKTPKIETEETVFVETEQYTEEIPTPAEEAVPAQSEAEVENDFAASEESAKDENEEPLDEEEKEETSEDNGEQNYTKEEEKEEDSEEKSDAPEEETEEKDDEEKKKYSLLETEYSVLQEKYSALEEKYNELVTFKAQVEDAKKDEMIKSFCFLSDEDKKEVIENKSKYSLEEIESKLSVICVRNKVNFNLDNNLKNDINTEEPIVTTFTVENEGPSIPAWIAALKNNQKK